MGCCTSGPNQFLSLNVPSNGDGAALDVSALGPSKTLFLSGAFVGRFVVLGSLDGLKYAPLATFNGADTLSNAGLQSFKVCVKHVLRFVKLRRPPAAQSTVVAGVAGASVCAC